MADESNNNKGGAPSRVYVILEQQHFEDDKAEYFVEIHRVTARNGKNALRKAYQEVKGEAGEANLVPIPASMWKPTKVAGRQRSGVTVTVGDGD
jgi:hypothetical protein